MQTDGIAKSIQPASVTQASRLPCPFLASVVEETARQAGRLRYERGLSPGYST